MSGIGAPGFILLIILALVLFGPSKLPQMGRAVGSMLREFKQATRGLTLDDDDFDVRKQKQVTAEEAQPPDRDTIEKEIRQRLERERLEADIREKLEIR